MKHAVIDLETRDTIPSAKIVSVGMVIVDDQVSGHLSSALINTFYEEISWESQHTRTESEETAIWWDQQSDRVKKALLGTERLWSVLVKIQELLRVHEVDRVWGNGPIFDMGILEDAYRKYGLEIPWRFYNVRCYKTALEVMGIDPKAIPFSGTKHVALDDAVHEAKLLHLALRKKK